MRSTSLSSLGSSSRSFTCQFHHKAGACSIAQLDFHNSRKFFLAVNHNPSSSLTYRESTSNQITSFFSNTHTSWIILSISISQSLQSWLPPNNPFDSSICLPKPASWCMVISSTTPLYAPHEELALFRIGTLTNPMPSTSLDACRRF